MNLLSCKVRIYLVTSLYKIIDKVLANRLWEVSEEAISIAQGAFIKGRQIFDVALDANEVAEDYRARR